MISVLSFVLNVGGFSSHNKYMNIKMLFIGLFIFYCRIKKKFFKQVASHITTKKGKGRSSAYFILTFSAHLITR